MVSPIIEAKASGAEITRIINGKLAPALEGEDQSACVMAMLTLTLLIMKPILEAEQIQDGVMGCSQWLCLYLSSLDETGEEGKKVVAN
jgi:hypothetical protein